MASLAPGSPTKIKENQRCMHHIGQARVGRDPPSGSADHPSQASAAQALARSSQMTRRLRSRKPKSARARPASGGGRQKRPAATSKIQRHPHEYWGHILNYAHVIHKVLPLETRCCWLQPSSEDRTGAPSVWFLLALQAEIGIQVRRLCDLSLARHPVGPMRDLLGCPVLPEERKKFFLKQNKTKKKKSKTPELKFFRTQLGLTERARVASRRNSRHCSAKSNKTAKQYGNATAWAR